MDEELKSWSDAMLADRLGRLDKELRWAPRDHSRAIARAEARLEKAKQHLKDCQVQVAEATWKSHRFRFVPMFGAYWRDQLEQRRRAEEAAKAQVKWLEAQLERARQRQKRRAEWLELHRPELFRREELRAEWARRARGIGEARLEDARRRGQTVGRSRAEEEAWARRAGEAELRRRVAEARERERARSEARRWA